MIRTLHYNDMTIRKTDADRNVNVRSFWGHNMDVIKSIEP